MKKKTHNFKDKLPRLDYQFGTQNFVSAQIGWKVWWKINLGIGIEDNLRFGGYISIERTLARPRIGIRDIVSSLKDEYEKNT